MVERHGRVDMPWSLNRRGSGRELASALMLSGVRPLGIGKGRFGASGDRGRESFVVARITTIFDSDLGAMDNR